MEMKREESVRMSEKCVVYVFRWERLVCDVCKRGFESYYELDKERFEILI